MVSTRKSPLPYGDRSTPRPLGSESMGNTLKGFGLGNKPPVKKPQAVTVTGNVSAVPSNNTVVKTIPNITDTRPKNYPQPSDTIAGIYNDAYKNRNHPISPKLTPDNTGQWTKWDPKAPPGPSVADQISGYVYTHPAQFSPKPSAPAHAAVTRKVSGKAPVGNKVTFPAVPAAVPPPDPYQTLQDQYSKIITDLWDNVEKKIKENQAARAAEDKALQDRMAGYYNDSLAENASRSGAARAQLTDLATKMGAPSMGLSPEFTNWGNTVDRFASTGQLNKANALSTTDLLGSRIGKLAEMQLGSAEATKGQNLAQVMSTILNARLAAQQRAAAQAAARRSSRGGSRRRSSGGGSSGSGYSVKGTETTTQSYPDIRDALNASDPSGGLSAALNQAWNRSAGSIGTLAANNQALIDRGVTPLAPGQGFGSLGSFGTRLKDYVNAVKLDPYISSMAGTNFYPKTQQVTTSSATTKRK